MVGFFAAANRPSFYYSKDQNKIQWSSFYRLPNSFYPSSTWFEMARIYEEVHDIQEPLLRDAVEDAVLVEKEATWFYRDFTGTSSGENCGTEIRLSWTRQCSRSRVGFDYRWCFHRCRYLSRLRYYLASHFLDYSEFQESGQLFPCLAPGGNTWCYLQHHWTSGRWW